MSSKPKTPRARIINRAKLYKEGKALATFLELIPSVWFGDDGSVFVTEARKAGK